MINQPLSSQTIHQILSTYNSQYFHQNYPNETSNTFALHHTTSTTPNPIESYTHFHKITKNALSNALPFPNPTLNPKHHQARISSFIKDYITFNNQIPPTNNYSLSDKHLFLTNALHIYDTHTTSLLQKQLQTEFNNSFTDNTSTVIDLPQMVQAQQDNVLSNEEGSESVIEESNEMWLNTQNNNVNQEGGSNMSSIQDNLLQYNLHSDTYTDIDVDDYEGTDELSDNTSTYD